MSTLAVDAIVDSSNGNTATINGATPTVYNTMGKNRIINGAMEIDQRNAGSAYTITGDGQYGVDRFQARTFAGSGRFSMQQVSDAPTGFLNSLKITVTTTDTSGTNGYSVDQRIEGLNITDFNFGSASAKTYTLSFWVKSSIAGTYAVSNRNTLVSSSCVFTYTINSANTWEKKTITFPANTSYTTGTDNGIGLLCDFSFGAQTSKSTSTLGEWISGNYVFNSGQVDLMQTSGATFYITGVQLEVGSVATEFERRLYSTELQLCQRYYYRCSQRPLGYSQSSAQLFRGSVDFPTTMRVAPSLDSSGNSFTVNSGAPAAGTVGLYTGSGSNPSPSAAYVYNSSNNWGAYSFVAVSAGFSSEL